MDYIFSIRATGFYYYLNENRSGRLCCPQITE